MLRKTIKRTLIASVLFGTQISFAENMTITSTTGDASVPMNPAKAVVLEWGILDNMAALGVDTTDFALTSNLLSETLEKKYEKNARIGNFMTPDLEKIIAYEPQVNFVAYFSPSIKDLQGIAPTVAFPANYNDQYVAKAKENMLTLAKLFGKEKKATELNAELDKKLAQARELTKETGGALFLQITGKNIAALGNAEGSRYGWVFSDIGFKEAAKDLDPGQYSMGQPVSAEFIKEHNPDWLIVLDRGTITSSAGESAQQVLDNDLIHETKAWKNGNILYLPEMSYLGDGSIPNMIEVTDMVIEKLKK